MIDNGLSACCRNETSNMAYQGILLRVSSCGDTENSMATIIPIRGRRPFFLPVGGAVCSELERIGPDYRCRDARRQLVASRNPKTMKKDVMCGQNDRWQKLLVANSLRLHRSTQFQTPFGVSLSCRFAGSANPCRTMWPKRVGSYVSRDGREHRLMVRLGKLLLHGDGQFGRLSQLVCGADGVLHFLRVVIK